MQIITINRSWYFFNAIWVEEGVLFDQLIVAAN